MKLKQLGLFNLIENKKALKSFASRGVTVFATKHACTLLKDFIISKPKFYQITDDTKKRVSVVPIDEIKGSSLLSLRDKKETGLVFFDDGLHFLYSVRSNGVYIMSSNAKYFKGVNGNIYAANLMSGFVYYDFFSDNVALYINSVIDAIYKPDHGLLKDMESLRLLKKISDDKQLYDIETENHYRKYDQTSLCMKAFMFIFFAKVLNTTTVSEENDNRNIYEKLNKKPIGNIDIIKVDSFYDHSIKVINPFSVSGHFRNQPIGKNRMDKKMIYIDQFMKSGYTRLATKQKIGLELCSNIAS